MGKRTKNRSFEHIMKKIRKLESELSKRQRTESSSSEDSILLHTSAAQAGADLKTPLLSASHEGSPIDDQAPELIEDQPAASTNVPIETNPCEAPSNEGEYPELDNEVLIMLGEAPKQLVGLGPAIHKDLAARWQEILNNGLTKESKDAFFQEYITPENCEYLSAPQINPEVKAAMYESLVKRDMSLMHKQKLLTAALTALGSAFTAILRHNNEISKDKTIIKPLSDACRILCDAHFTETKIRRRLIIDSMNPAMKSTLTESKRDKSFLFGEKMGENLKSAKSIQRSGESLKQPRSLPQPNQQRTKSTANLNFKAPLPKKQTRPSNVVAGNRGMAPPIPRQSRGGYRYPPPQRSPSMDQHSRQQRRK